MKSNFSLIVGCVLALSVVAVWFYKVSLPHQENQVMMANLEHNKNILTPPYTSKTPPLSTVATQPVVTQPVAAQSVGTQPVITSGSAQSVAVAAQSDSSSKKSSQSQEEQKKFDLSFDDLKFEMEKSQDFDRSMLTEKINEYNGAKIQLRGYIRPSFTADGLTKFVFVRDNKVCCFGPKAAIFDNVLVKLAAGNTTDYTVRPITIEGDLMLKEYKGPDDKVWSIYRMKNTVVK